MKSWGLSLALALAAGLFLVVLMTRLGYPLVWADESETVMFGKRILEFGYPKVHDEKNTLYALKERREVGVHEPTDAYTGKPWVDYYVAAVGVALAEWVDDPYRKTFFLRLPFTLIGVLGLVLLFIAVGPALSATPDGRRLSAIVYALMLTVSIVLILHLREARYYSIVILLFAGLLYSFCRYHFFSRISYRQYTLTTIVALFILFNTFYPAFGVWVVAASIYLGVRVLRTGGTWRERVFAYVRLNAPVFLATLTVLPLLLFFDFVSQVDRRFDQSDNTIGAYFGNVQSILYTLWSFEFLALALLLKVLVVIQRPRNESGGWPDTFMPHVSTSRFLATLIVSYGLIIARSPYVFERYYLTAGPLITIMVLLDGHLLWMILREHGKPRLRRLRSVSNAALFAVVLIALLNVRTPEMKGRWYEMTHQYRGPLDYAVPYILDTYEHPEELVVATNYEGPAYMYYLDCKTTIGYFGANLQDDLRVQPDIIIMRPWGRNRNVLSALAARATYRMKVFDIRNQMTNNIPALSRYTPGGLRHRFRTEIAENPSQRFFILERVRDTANAN